MRREYAEVRKEDIWKKEIEEIKNKRGKSLPKMKIKQEYMGKMSKDRQS